jgi:hypothetical protein
MMSWARNAYLRSGMVLLLSSLFVVADRGNYTPFLRFSPEHISNSAKVNVAGTIDVALLTFLAVPDGLARKHPLVVVADELNHIAWAQVPAR